MGMDLKKYAYDMRVLRQAFLSGDRAQFDAILSWPRHSQE